MRLLIKLRSMFRHRLWLSLLSSAMCERWHPKTKLDDSNKMLGFTTTVHPPPAAQVLRYILEAAAAGPYVWFTDKSWTWEWKQDYRLNQKWIFVDREGNWVSPMSWHYDVAHRIWPSWVLLRGMWFWTSSDSLSLGYCHGREPGWIWKNSSPIFMPTKNYIGHEQRKSNCRGFFRL